MGKWLSGVLVLCLSAGVGAEDRPDLEAVHRIRQEGLQASQVMDHLFALTDANGPRLTGSPGFKRAAEWAAGRLKEWGVTSAHVESWGRFGRGWSLEHYSANLVEPTVAALHGVPLAWSGGTKGSVTAEVVSAPLWTAQDREVRYDVAKVDERIRTYIAAQRGKLRGRIVLLDPAPDLKPPVEAASRRYDEAQLQDEAKAPEPFAAPPLAWPLKAPPADPKKRRELFESLPIAISEDYYRRLESAARPLYTFFNEEGVVGVLQTDTRGDGGIVFAEGTSAWSLDSPVPPPIVVLEPEAYGRLVRLAEKKIATKVALDVAVHLDDQAEGLNVVAELPGGKKKDEIVMLGAHLDSWHAGTGATDNGAGSAVVLEAMRILKALNLPLDRTVRLALWGGEEEGYFGSRAYVREHFADPLTKATKPEHARLSGYFNLDNGTGKVRGVYLQGNDMMRPVFEAWLSPFRDLGVTTISVRNTGGTDHEAFDEVGLPGFQFIQDPMDYGTRTHHSSLDVYDHAVAADLMQAATVMASCVYHAANRPERLPRKPMPKPLPPKSE
ncbi:MAG TPA: M20/M25/M40 family metallo-hydrolase [Vicinamibacteria bacterium]|nr:M20/M25/M40 family metallo-hydrolase [Vicinamibacteria bacterium]